MATALQRNKRTRYPPLGNRAIEVPDANSEAWPPISTCNHSNSNFSIQTLSRCTAHCTLIDLGIYGQTLTVPANALSPKAMPKLASRSFSAGIFAPPVKGVHQLSK